MPKLALIWAFLALLTALSALIAASPAQAAPRSPAPIPAAATTPAGATTSSGATSSGAVDSSRAATLSRAGASSRAMPLAHAAAVRAVPVSRAARLAQASLLRGKRVLAAAGAQRGKPYRHGASGPRAFDCSGLAGYAYRAVHVRLPRTANAQYRAAHPITRAAARPGDLVFWVHGRHAYHVAVYAGAGRVWHAPKPGDHVRLAKIWSPREVRFGRVPLD